MTFEHIWAYLSNRSSVKNWRTEDPCLALVWPCLVCECCGHLWTAMWLKSEFKFFDVAHQAPKHLRGVELIFGRSLDPLNSNSSDLCLTFVTFRKLMNILCSKCWNFKIQMFSTRFHPGEGHGWECRADNFGCADLSRITLQDIQMGKKKEATVCDRILFLSHSSLWCSNFWTTASNIQ